MPLVARRRDRRQAAPFGRLRHGRSIGKWGLGEPGTTGIPNRQGFDYWFGYLDQVHAHNYYPDYLWRNEEKVPLPNVVNGAWRRSAWSIRPICSPPNR